MNNKIKLTGTLMVALMLFFSACKDETTEPMDNTEDKSSLSLMISGLEDLGADAVYEGWIIVNGSPVSTGTFTVDGSGDMSSTSFSLNKTDLDAASTFVLTIEPMPDNDPTPSKVHILAGDFSGTDASLNISHAAALNDDFSSSAGAYILATPTDTSSSNEESGIWFLDNSSGSPMVGLSLPVLPEGWAYEGWVVISGTPVSTGTFTAVDMADASAPYSGAMSGPPFPGEDFLNNAPSPLSFPTDIKGGKAVISIEPVPDNSPMPFTLKPLVGDISGSAPTHTKQDMMQNLVFPTGSASR